MATRAVKKAKGSTARGGAAELLRFLLLLFVATLALRSLVAAPFSIPSGSMLPTLAIGDHLFVAKWPYGWSRWSFPGGAAPIDGRLWGALPRRGDVVVFKHPDTGADWVKRVIGLPGDRVAVKGGTVILNGRPLPRTRVADHLVPISPNSPCRAAGGGTGDVVAGADGAPACAYPRYRERLPDGRTYLTLDQLPYAAADSAAEVRVPAGQLFLLGDNRDDSRDSRFSTADGGVGLLPLDRVQGRALIVYFSTNGAAAWLKPWTWDEATRWHRIGATPE